MNGFIHYEKVSQRFSILEESRDFVSLHMGRPDLPLPLFEKVLQMLIKMTEAEKAARKGNAINKTTLGLIKCRFKEAVEIMEGCLDSWDCCSSFKQIRNIFWIISGNTYKDTQTFATFQLGTHITGGMSLSVTWQWYQDCVFDIKKMWVLSKVENISRAHVLLEVLKSRSVLLSLF
ncbi:hypothetical protein F2Q68_00035248 [Brassica cretica]|uniref:Uncharacterized protein n=1 Tax=Brassica cretica TaxID=69181 RepID=A0A8S9H332_BRACR|nr:hypothetical protein F2Q68_00035248 [Brassica cretica]